MRPILFALLAACFASGLHAQEKSRPNIVLIISDDQGGNDYGFCGHPHIKTPHLDRLASQSLVFRNAYVPSSLCCPSLAQIMTGKYGHQTKITSNDPPHGGKKGPKDAKYLEGRKRMNDQMAQLPTLARLLAQRGYLSFQTGKWWWGDFHTGGFTHGMTHGDPTKNGRHGDAGLDIGRKTMQPIYDFIAQSRKAEKPFFVWYAPMMPHTPHNPPDRLFEKYKDKTKSVHEARYWAMIEWFDETCGQLLDHLKTEGLDDNTIVLYVTDNGWIQNPNANGPMRSKLTHFLAGHHTPIMVRWSGKIRPETIEQPISSLDIAPTLLKAVGETPASDLPGIDLLDRSAVLARKAIMGADYTHDAVDLEKPGKSTTHRWIVEDRWRLIVPYGKGEVELYHLAEDPAEQRNVAAAQPERVRALRQKLDAWWVPGVMHSRSQALPGNALPARLCLAGSAEDKLSSRSARGHVLQSVEAEPRDAVRSQAEPGNENDELPSPTSRRSCHWRSSSSQRADICRTRSDCSFARFFDSQRSTLRSYSSQLLPSAGKTSFQEPDRNARCP